MDIKNLRTQRGWSQEQLAEMTAVSVRTIQRVENGETASPETLKALASVFEVPLFELAQQEAAQPDAKQSLSKRERRVLRDIRRLRGFYIHLFWFLAVCLMLMLINLATSAGYLWFLWVVFGWGIGVAFHGLGIWRPFRQWGAQWERQEFERRMRDDA